MYNSEYEGKTNSLVITVNSTVSEEYFLEMILAVIKFNAIWLPL